MSKLFVILPCYNEEESIQKLILRWRNEFSRLKKQKINEVEILIIDDGSKDNTVLEVEKLNESFITILKHPHNKGLGEAIKTGLLYCEKNGRTKDLICIMDADNTHSPVFVHKMIAHKLKTSVECVIASRYAQGSKVKGVSTFRKILSDGAGLYYHILLRIPNVRDYTCGYRLYGFEEIKKAVSVYGNDIIRDNGFTCMAELLYKLHFTGTSFSEVGFDLRYDFKEGSSKMKIIKTIFKSLYIPFKLKRSSKKDKQFQSNEKKLA